MPYYDRELTPPIAFEGRVVRAVACSTHMLFCCHGADGNPSINALSRSGFNPRYRVCGFRRGKLRRDTVLLFRKLTRHPECAKLQVHYVNDTERGVVWEEVIIMLPSYVNLVFLSATTPNTLEFCDWIGRTKRKPVYVVKTDFRPVPLSFNLWAGLKLHAVMESRGRFLEKGYSDAVNALLPLSAKDPNKKKNDFKGRPQVKTGTGAKQLAWQAQGSKANWMSLVRFLDRELLTPTVIFSFSKKKCEEIANMLQSLDLNTAKERSAVQGFSIQTVARLSQNDSKLPQVQMICEMVQRGVGIHHGGLLPILKEMVEILFSRNLIKVLFATETFAMGKLPSISNLPGAAPLQWTHECFFAS
jgi:antiviral helicase SKI2